MFIRKSTIVINFDEIHMLQFKHFSGFTFDEIHIVLGKHFGRTHSPRQKRKSASVLGTNLISKYGHVIKKTFPPNVLLNYHDDA